MLINGIKFACNTCIKGHRSSSCNHVERPLFEIRKKGRPVTQCAYCRDLRKTRQIHIKCSCTDKNKNSCYQCPSKQPYPTSSLAEEHGFSYNDIILSSSLLTQDQTPMQCTCHETAKTLLSSGSNPIQSNGVPPPLPLSEIPPPPSFQSKEKEFAWISPEKISPTATATSRPRNSFDDNNNMNANYYALQRSHSSSLRFLEGQTKSPRRRSSLSRKLSSKKSSSSPSSSSSSSVTATATAMITTTDNLNDSNATENNFSMTPNNMMSDYSENEDTMFIDMQNFDYGVMSTTTTSNQHFITETDPAEIITVPSSTTIDNHNHNHNHNNNNNNNNNNHSLGGVGRGGGEIVGNSSYHLSSSSSDSMTTTSTTSSITEEEKKKNKNKKKSMSYENFNLTNTDSNELATLLTNVLANEDNRGGRFEYMESSSRSSVDMTRTSTTSSSSGVLAPRAANVCGSLTPHTNCCPPVDTQGQSVVITITPLSSLFTEGGSEQVDNHFKLNSCAQQQQQQPIPITRIVTCYCGSSCSCPGCFVHPDNYLMCQFPTPSIPFQPSTSSSTTYYHHQPTALSSSTSSSYSSDDEDHNNYSAYATSTFY